MNMKGNSYHLAVNHFADLTDYEFERHKGLMPGDGVYGSRDFDNDDDEGDDNKGDGDNTDDYRNDEKRNKIKKNRYGHVPDELDWRKYGMNHSLTCITKYQVNGLRKENGRLFLN